MNSAQNEIRKIRSDSEYDKNWKNFFASYVRKYNCDNCLHQNFLKIRMISSYRPLH